MKEIEFDLTQFELEPDEDEECPGCGDTTVLDDGLCGGCWLWFIEHDCSYYEIPDGGWDA